MRSLVVYASTHGATEKAVRILSGYLSGEADVWCVKKRGSYPNIEQYDLVVIGGSIYAGSIQRSITRFMEIHRKTLMSKRVALFLCCILEGDRAQIQFEKAFPTYLRDRSIANGLFGGELIYSQLNLLQQMIVTSMMGIKNDVLQIDLDAIYDFAEHCKYIRSRIPFD